MRLLFDENLSWRLVGLLATHFPHSVHLVNTPLGDGSSDKNIWVYAKENSFVIVTNDEDFNFFSTTKGFPPKVVLLKMGNQQTKFISEVLIKHREDILSFCQNSELGILEII